MIGRAPWRMGARAALGLGMLHALTACHPELIPDRCMTTEQSDACNPEAPLAFNLGQLVTDWIGVRRNRLLYSLKLDEPQSLLCQVAARPGEVELNLYWGAHPVCGTATRQVGGVGVPCEAPSAGTYRAVVSVGGQDRFSAFAFRCDPLPAPPPVEQAAPPPAPIVQAPSTPEPAPSPSPPRERAVRRRTSSAETRSSNAANAASAPGTAAKSVLLSAKAVNVQPTEQSGRFKVQLEACRGLEKGASGRAEVASPNGRAVGRFVLEDTEYCDVQIDKLTNRDAMVPGARVSLSATD
jgi:hypothetical protein